MNKTLGIVENARAVQGFGVDTWDDEVTHTRYVDDVLMSSPRYCEGCLTEAIRQACSVPFDTASRCDKLEWLDMEICTETTRTTGTEKLRNEAGMGIGQEGTVKLHPGTHSTIEGSDSRRHRRICTNN